ncbi:MAG: ABC transporter substrate-binding protein, partial [Ruminiclostridium sp.]
KKSYIDKNKGTIQKFTDALYEGQVWVDTHTPKEIAEAIKSSFPDTDLAILETVAKRYQDIDAWCKDPVLKESSFELLQTVMDKAGQLKQKAPYANIVDTTYAKKAMK